jgi:hypothetical protein
MGALLVGIGCSALTLVIGQVGFAMTQSRILRAVVAAAFIVPAGIAGYHLVLGMSQIGVPSLVWRETFAWIGAVRVGMTAWARISASRKARLLRSTEADIWRVRLTSRALDGEHHCGERPNNRFSRTRQHPPIRLH